MTTGQQADQPPSQPEDWVERDRDLGSQVALWAGIRSPYRGATAHPCGGAWRYRLMAPGVRPVYRCLHCGEVGVEGAATGAE